MSNKLKSAEKRQAEMNDELKEKVERYEWNSTNGGGFMATICKAISIADMENLTKLYKVFPDLVDGYTGMISYIDFETYKNR